jgi:hypothetical protein
LVTEILLIHNAGEAKWSFNSGESWGMRSRNGIYVINKFEREKKVSGIFPPPPHLKSQNIAYYTAAILRNH